MANEENYVIDYYTLKLNVREVIEIKLKMALVFNGGNATNEEIRNYLILTCENPLKDKLINAYLDTLYDVFKDLAKEINRDDECIKSACAQSDNYEDVKNILLNSDISECMRVLLNEDDSYLRSQIENCLNAMHTGEDGMDM